jgi:hypothetical protein
MEWRMKLLYACLVFTAFFLMFPKAGESQEQPGIPEPPIERLTTIEPSSPVDPEVAARDLQGQLTLRATRLNEPLVLDGRLDETIYTSVKSFGDFIQQEPHEGQPATDNTDVWLFYDSKNVYISLRVWYRDPETIIANEMRRDGQPVWSTNDNIGVVLDTFHDHRSGFYVNTNALGAVRDALLTDEDRNTNLDFNFVWDVKSRRFDQGWMTEIAIPFKSLRYPAGREQVWGFNIQRVDRSKNELSHLTPIPASYGGSGIWRVSAAATLVGIEAPLGGGRFELKPYVLSSVSTDRQTSPLVSNDGSASIGFDARYKVTRGLNADFTYNTDFAQVEADNQQINLGRFSLFYPEKRDFFLEAQTVFNFGADNAPVLFFSRRIGLTPDGEPVPIAGGGRLLGNIGRYTVGLMSIRTKDAADGQVPETTFSVMRLRRNVLRRSAIGLLFTDRSPSLTNSGTNQVLGLDAALGLFQSLNVNAYYARSRTPGRSDGQASYQGRMEYGGDRYGLTVNHINVGPGFDPQIGFLLRPAGYVRNFVLGRFSPRPARLPGVRKLSWEGALEHVASTAGVTQTRVFNGTFRIFENSGDQLDLSRLQTQDRPQSPFRVAGAPVAAGIYDFAETKLSYLLGPERPLTGTATISRGSYYGGRKTELSYNGRVSATSQFIIEPIVTLNWLDMPAGRFTSKLVSARNTYTMTPRMFVAALIQYNSTAARLGINLRFRWEYQPGSDFFVVYNDGRDTLGGGFPSLLNRSISIKFTHLFRG